MGAGASKTAVAAAQHAAAAAARSARRAPPDASLVRSTADSRDVARRAGAPLAGVAATADAPYAAPATAPTGASPLEAEARALLERVNRRPALHRRLDDDSGDAGAAAPVVDGGGVARTVPGDAAAEDVEALWRGRRLADDEAAGVQAAAEGAPGAAAGSDGAVVVRRVRGSSATDTLSDADREALHAKSPATSAGAAALGDGITEAPGDAAGASALAVWDAMQLNPALLDSAAALSRSHVQAAFAALALGVSPDAARLTASSQRRAELTAGSVNSGGGGGAVQSGGGSAASGAPSAPPSALVPLSPEAMDALVPANSSLDTLMLARPPPAGVVAWGHRPPEGSPYDQLILHDADEESRLERGVRARDGRPEARQRADASKSARRGLWRMPGDRLCCCGPGVRLALCVPAPDRSG